MMFIEFSIGNYHKHILRDHHICTCFVKFKNKKKEKYLGNFIEKVKFGFKLVKNNGQGFAFSLPLKDSQ